MSLHTPAHKQTTQPVSDIFKNGAKGGTPPALESAPVPQDASAVTSEKPSLGIVANPDRKTLWGAHLG